MVHLRGIVGPHLIQNNWKPINWFISRERKRGKLYQIVKPCSWKFLPSFKLCLSFSFIFGLCNKLFIKLHFHV